MVDGMWQKSYTTTIEGVSLDAIWAIWSNVPNRPAWDSDTEWAKADGPFQTGTVITFKPKGWPKTVSMTIIECIKNECFTDHTRFFLADLYGKHHMIKYEQGICLTTTIILKGPLAWFWRKIVGEDIVKTLPLQTSQLVQLARNIT